MSDPKEIWWVTPPDEELYVKRGRRYFPAVQATGYMHFEGFPANGVWLVSTKRHLKSERCIKQIETEKLLDLDEIKRVAGFEQYREALTHALHELGRELSDALFQDKETSYSLAQIADILIAAMAGSDPEKAPF